jgi:hypothetical protein
MYKKKRPKWSTRATRSTDKRRTKGERFKEKIAEMKAEHLEQTGEELKFDGSIRVELDTGEVCYPGNPKGTNRGGGRGGKGDRLKVSLSRELKERFEKDPTIVERIVDVLINAGVENEAAWAIQEMFDRVEGKAAQKIEVSNPQVIAACGAVVAQLFGEEQVPSFLERLREELGYAQPDSLPEDAITVEAEEVESQ